MPETVVEQQAPAVTEEPTKEKEILDEEGKKDDSAEGNEKKDAEKKEKEETKKAKKVKKAKEPAPPPPPPVHKKDFDKDVVYLYQFPRCPTLPSISPSCLKVETWLKLHGIKYENVDHNVKLRSKRGLLPFIEQNGEEIADSENIIKSLAKTYDKDTDENLTGEEKNIQHAMLTVADHHFNGAFWYWASRNPDELIKGYKLNLQQFTGCKVPNGLLKLWYKVQHCRKGLKRAKAITGSGYTDEEIEVQGKKDLLVLKETLGDKQFFFGDEPHMLDLVLFSYLAQIINLQGDVKCPLKDYLESDCTNLVGLYNRVKDRAWGDHWDEAIGDKMELNPHIPKPEPPQEEEKKDEGKKKEEESDNKKKEGNEKGDKDEKEKGDKKEEENKE